jgi:hypothetical protein
VRRSISSIRDLALEIVHDPAELVEVDYVDGTRNRIVPWPDVATHRALGAMVDQTGQDVWPVVEIDPTLDRPLVSDDVHLCRRDLVVLYPLVGVVRRE